MSSVSFFFQAEDGIRDLVRSRGLGDVYKRQDVEAPGAIGGKGDRASVGAVAREEVPRAPVREAPGGAAADGHFIDAVSYTHLTLPTSDLV